MNDLELESLFEDLAGELSLDAHDLPAAASHEEAGSHRDPQPMALSPRSTPDHRSVPVASSLQSALESLDVFDNDYADQAALALESAVPAGALLGDSDPFGRVTRPYEVPLEELLETNSALCTVPINLDELPDDAYPTETHMLPCLP